MKSIVWRIEAHREAVDASSFTASTRELLVRIEQGREGVRKMREKDGLPPDEDWAPKKIHTSHGTQPGAELSDERSHHGQQFV